MLIYHEMSFKPLGEIVFDNCMKWQKMGSLPSLAASTACDEFSLKNSFCIIASPEDITEFYADTKADFDACLVALYETVPQNQMKFW